MSFNTFRENKIPQKFPNLQYLGHDPSKPDIVACEQQRRRMPPSHIYAQAESLPCYSLPAKYDSLTCFINNMGLDARKPGFGGLRTTKGFGRLISASLFHLLESTISKLSTSKILIF